MQDAGTKPEKREICILIWSLGVSNLTPGSLNNIICVSITTQVLSWLQLQLNGDQQLFLTSKYKKVNHQPPDETQVNSALGQIIVTTIFHFNSVCLATNWYENISLEIWV